MDRRGGGGLPVSLRGSHTFLRISSVERFAEWYRDLVTLCPETFTSFFSLHIMSVFSDRVPLRAVRGISEEKMMAISVTKLKIIRMKVPGTGGIVQSFSLSQQTSGCLRKRQYGQHEHVRLTSWAGGVQVVSGA